MSLTPGLVGESHRAEPAKEGDEALLFAEGLRLDDRDDETGFADLGVDGAGRALAYRAEFARRGEPTVPKPDARPTVRLRAPASAHPASPFEVRLELDDPLTRGEAAANVSAGTSAEVTVEMLRTLRQLMREEFMRGRRVRAGMLGAAALALVVSGAGWAQTGGGDARGPVLIVAPHPDDETLGCGGLIAQRRAEGRRVVVAVLTDGRALLVRFGILDHPTPEEVSKLRKDETRRSFKILGGDPADLRFLDFENERLVAQKREAVAKVAALIKEVAPAEVYVTSPFEGHAEHVAANAIVREAVGASGQNPALFEYTVSLKRGVKPDELPRRRVTVDVSAQRAKEREALNVFRSHLGTLSPRQTKPLRENYDDYLTPTETFFVEGGSGR